MNCKVKTKMNTANKDTKSDWLNERVEVPDFLTNNIPVLQVSSSIPSFGISNPSSTDSKNSRNAATTKSTFVASSGGFSSLGGSSSLTPASAATTAATSPSSSFFPPVACKSLDS